jgi:S-adenosylhomocysteine hydrolase
MTVGKPQYDDKDLGARRPGKARIEWAAREMPSARADPGPLRAERCRSAGLTLAAASTSPPRPANLAIALRAGGANALAIDQEIARLKLAAMNVSIDTLTEEQQRYLASWEMGT